jgi:hypothetical protein
LRGPDEGGGLWAALTTTNPAGAIVRLELKAEDGALLQVEVARDRFETLAPRTGERLYVRPRRLPRLRHRTALRRPIPKPRSARRKTKDRNNIFF